MPKSESARDPALLHGRSESALPRSPDKLAGAGAFLFSRRSLLCGTAIILLTKVLPVGPCTCLACRVKAWGICDGCGMRYDYHALKWQEGMLVCSYCVEPSIEWRDRLPYCKVLENRRA